MGEKKYKTSIVAIIFILLSSMIINAENISIETEKPEIENTETLKDIQKIEKKLAETESPNTSTKTKKTVKINETSKIKPIKKSENITLQKKDEEKLFSSSSSFENISKKNISEKNETNTYINIDRIISNNTILNKTDTLKKSISKSSSKKEKNKSEETIQEKKSTNKTKEKIKIQLYKNGKKEIEGKIPESFTSEIKKIEIEISDSKKEVVVKSTEHLESPLTVYSDIKETKSKEEIEIYWKNKNKKINVKEYLDTNNNGLIDRISWIVPHLSEQIFEIIIIPSTKTESEEILISIKSPEGTVTNPVEFNFSINYTNISNLDCTLSIEETNYTINPYSQQITTSELQNGDHSWNIVCIDPINSKEKTKTGVFTINEKEFLITQLENIYLNTEEIIFQVNTPQDTSFEGKLIRPDNSIINLATNQNSIGSNLFNEPGTYTLNLSNNYYEETIYTSKTFNIIDIDIVLDKTTAEINEEIDILVKLNSPSKQITSTEIDFNDGSKNITYTTQTFNEKNIYFYHKYAEKENYNVKLSFESDGKKFEIESETISIKNPNDNNEKPTISLTFPKDNSIIESDTVTFKYEVDDDKEISKCTYELYIKEDSWKELDYTTTKNSPELNKEIEIKLTAFDDGEYTWYIICEDNQGKESEESRSFTIKTTRHQYENEINEAIESLENFLEKKEDYKLEEKEVLKELGISEDLTYYKKRLIQINQDLGTNIKFISNKNLKEERTEETIKELKEISKNIPKNIEITESTEFIKNSLNNLEKITEEYTKAKKIELKSNDIKKLAKENEIIQEKLGVTIQIKTVEIKYKDRTEKITSIKKEINLIDNSHKIILEKVPDEIKDIEFKTQSQEINKNLFEINTENIENDEIIYHIKEEIKIDKLKETETILFEEFPSKRLSMTGHFLLNEPSIENSTYYIIFIIFLIIALYFGQSLLKKTKIKTWKKEENVRRILEYSEKAKKALQQNEQEIAKDYYHKTKEIFNLTPKGFKSHIYPIIKKIRIGIDKRDMQNFIKEYEEAKKEKRTEDCERIYKNIQNQYKKLPQRYQEKVYERVIKKENNNFTL